MLTKSRYLFGDWGGERNKLANEKGISFDFSFTTEGAHNIAGGKQSLTRFSSQLAAGVNMDLDKLWGIHATTFGLIFTDRFGRSLDTDAALGTSEQTREIYGRGQTVWLTKLTLGRKFFDGALDIAVGRDSEGSDFGYADVTFKI